MEFIGSQSWILDKEDFLKDENSDVVADFFITNEKDLANATLASKSIEMFKMLKRIHEKKTITFDDLIRINKLLTEATISNEP